MMLKSELIDSLEEKDKQSDVPPGCFEFKEKLTFDNLVRIRTSYNRDPWKRLSNLLYVLYDP